MKFDFTQFIDRMGKDAIAVEMPPNGALTKPEWKDKQIPMWVADQNFPTFPPIKEKMIERASIEWSSDNALDLNAQATAYYMDESSIIESSKTFNLESKK